MRTVSGTRNRVILAIGGLLLMLPAAWIALITTPLGDWLPPHRDELLSGESTGSGIAAAHAAWLLPTFLAIGAVAVVAGISLLVSQVPRPPARAVLRITDADGKLLGSLEPEVFERALAENMTKVPGVLNVDVRFGGSTQRPWVQATTTLAEEAEMAWVVQLLRARLVRDVETTLATAPETVDLLVRLRTGRSSRNAALGLSAGERAPVREAVLR
ncbi:hypothetical protein [Brevibacterium sp.]|uniref:hypothetical protein n=1 Tax=Brevibacterium sp. TaxID=1701 RepID=UPI0025C6E3FF|nr:hypothetical protein [Brevibacterium sp.]